MRRPIGITLIALLAWLNAAVLAWMLVGALFTPASLPPTVGGSVAATTAVLALVMLLDAAAGYGLWRLRVWGHRLMVILLAINLAQSAAALFMGIVPAWGPLLSIAFNGFLLWYLFRRETIAAFMRAKEQRADDVTRPPLAA